MNLTFEIAAGFYATGGGSCLRAIMRGASPYIVGAIHELPLQNPKIRLIGRSGLISLRSRTTKIGQFGSSPELRIYANA